MPASALRSSLSVCYPPTLQASLRAVSAIRSCSTEDGGILDDLMITRMSGESSKGFALVVNGATKIDDIAFLL